MRLRKQFVITAEKFETCAIRQESPQTFQTYREMCDPKVSCLTGSDSDGTPSEY